jgi:hypothetical protein
VTPGRHRWRTWLRVHLPMWATGLVPKGETDCGNHEWYRSDAQTWRCYHCSVGIQSDRR